MRDILLIILLFCMCLRACDNNNFNGSTCNIEMIKGHEYIVCRDVFTGVSIIHAESCNCKK